ncbi:MAG: anthranilate phosphoribosyltransferase [Frankiales bacterium]|nr:anthranilate phosphoribosyltransferase [Frankiales bacterium]
MTPPPPSWPSLLTALLHSEDLAHAEAAWAMEQVMSGDATDVQIAGFALALRAKGETPAEVEALVEVMLRHAARLTVEGTSVDTCGTGGDRAHTVNISTMAALVVAGAGVTVVKHGNRAASSATGSADVLEALGVAVDLAPALVGECIRTAGIGFCFAPVFHPALRFAGPARAQLGIPTVFNFLGPLTNPAQPRAQAVGVYDARMAPVMATVFARRGTSALVFRGDDGLDELSTATTSRVWLVRDRQVHESVLNPVELGIPRSPAEALRGGDRDRNADVVRALLAGEQGAVRDAVVLNAAAALVAASPGEESLDRQLIDGIRRASEALDSGAAAAALDRWVTTSKALVPG